MGTGQLGLSAYGKHLDFPSRVEEGLWLSEFCHAKSMIDITDGLVIDLNRLLNNKFEQYFMLMHLRRCQI